LALLELGKGVCESASLIELELGVGGGSGVVLSEGICRDTDVFVEDAILACAEKADLYPDSREERRVCQSR
jgi:hypothetical protein